MVDKDWKLLGGNDYCGEAIAGWLREAKTDHERSLKENP